MWELPTSTSLRTRNTNLSRDGFSIPNRQLRLWRASCWDVLCCRLSIGTRRIQSQVRLRFYWLIVVTQRHFVRVQVHSLELSNNKNAFPREAAKTGQPPNWNKLLQTRLGRGHHHPQQNPRHHCHPVVSRGQGTNPQAALRQSCPVPQAPTRVPRLVGRWACEWSCIEGLMERLWGQ